MDLITVERRPELHDPIAVIAFAGWNDAASSATNAARFVARRLGARKFATTDPEELYDFRESRPTVRIDIRGERLVNWPTNEFFYARNPTGPHDVIVAIGVEPNLRWRGFAESYASLFRDLGVVMVVTLGALMADVPHTRPVRVTGTAADLETAVRLNLETSRYEGPTGVVGVLHTTLRSWGVGAASLWANVPHYLTTTQNPPATAALLRRLQDMVGMEWDLAELESAGQRFVGEVDSAVNANPEVREYVAKLEAALDAGNEPGRSATSGDLLVDIEEFLRSQRDDAS